ncbi:hypothetical protein P280DRAFT_526790 [Massarina eburnea CBS 473.64]|uniref:Uncharacterized protein n=1 Tax=Massarina eburnea CBS 473.64 TaxID=1395130 RepID=A0A6A6S2F6_9PLEO|nr:hypothetical protein P280DRAFT_526790 [Massarina eburnea CBS 473.64]
MSDEEGNEDIAAAMGFSSFGGVKKRKYDQTNSPKAKPDASGANSTKLGVRPKLASEDSPVDNAPQSQPPSASKTTTTKGKQNQNQPAASGLAAFLNRGQSLPDKPPKSDEIQTNVPVTQELQGDPDPAHMISFGAKEIPRAELNVLRNGVKDGNGDTAYFLPSFVEDPWAGMRKVKS